MLATSRYIVSKLLVNFLVSEQVKNKQLIVVGQISDIFVQVMRKL